MNRRFIRALSCMLILPVFTACGTAKAEALSGRSDQPHGPGSCEIHLLLDSDRLLDREGLLTKKACSFFEITKKYKTYGLAYVETPDRAFQRAGWINRIRMQQGKAKKGFSLTYKKRYAVDGGDIAAAMRLAESEGFSVSGGMWEAQIEWGYSAVTLSLSAEASCPADGLDGIGDLDSRAAADMIRAGMPAEELDRGAGLWETSDAGPARMIGPVYFKRYTGEYLGRDVRIEVWDIPAYDSAGVRRIVELSYETTDLEDAADMRESLIQRLAEQGLLLRQDGLKTQQVMNAFLGE